MHSTSSARWALLLGTGLVGLWGCHRDEKDRLDRFVDEAGAGGTGAAFPVTGGAPGGGTAPTGGQSLGGADSGGTGGVGGSVTGGVNGGLGGDPGGAGAAGEGPGGLGSAGAAGGFSGGVAGSGAEAGGGAGGASALPTLGDPCLDFGDCAPGELCYRGLTSTRSCRSTCELADVGTGRRCGPSELCVLQEGGAQAACLRLCTPFVTPTECPETEWCLPHPNVGYTGGSAVDGLCVEQAAGTGEGGEECETMGCAAGLTCYSTTGSMLGYDHCEPVCDPMAAPGAAGSCPLGASCRAPIGSGQPACLTLCDPFGSVTCEAGEHCVAYQDSDGEQTWLEGHCVQPGLVPLGAPCTPGDCAAGLDCLVDPPPFDQARRCRPTCDVEAPATCGTSASCLPVAEGTSGVGTCEADCTPFAVGLDAGCAADEWCSPTYAGAEAGFCVAVGTTPIGAECSASVDCAAGGYCDCRFGRTLGCTVERACVSSCLPSLAPGAPGGCALGQRCVRPSVWGGEPASLGICREGCDFAAGETCSDPSETCVPGELLADGADACLDVPPAASPLGEYCFLLGVDPGDPCGPTALCTLLPGDLLETCVEVCRVSEGPLGAADHPDCAEPMATCVELAPGLAYGRCF